jgi:thioredoxin reductase (NADPH)
VRRPVILTVDDDPAVLGAVRRDLRSRYAENWRVLAAGSGEEALEALRELRLREDPVALLIVDQRMPGMSGVELLAAASELHPDAKRALLTAYADTDAAIAAINEVHAHHYLLKPWDPPEDRLYPVLDELLDEWLAGFRPPFEGVRVVAPQWSPAAHRLKEFLGRNRVPYRSLDAEGSPEAAELLASAGAGATLPLVVLEDGRVLAAPDVGEVAAAVGMRTRSELPLYDLVVVGGGPAGLAAAVYGASEGLRTLLVEGEAVGGQAGTSSRIENYLGFPNGVSGAELARRARDQAVRLHAELLVPCAASSLRLEEGYKLVQLGNGDEVNARALVVAGGVTYRRLNAESCDRLTGAGVYYGAAHSEAVDVTGADVVVVGGANSAGQAAVKLAEQARSVTLLVRGASIATGMSAYLVEQVDLLANVVVRTEVEVEAARGIDHLESVTVRDRRSGEAEHLPTTAMFAFIGAQPHTEWLDGVVARDDHGFLPTGPELTPGQLAGWPLERPPYLLETNVAGLFAAGDVRQGSVKRVASAVGEGAVATTFVHRYLAET